MRMDEPLIECQPVDEGFQSGARTPEGGERVDLTRNVGVEKVFRARVRDEPARAGVEYDGGAVFNPPGAKALHVGGEEPLHVLLQPEAQGPFDHAFGRERFHEPRVVGRKKRKVRRTAYAQGKSQRFRPTCVNHPFLQEHLAHAPALRFEFGVRHIGSTLHGVLRHDGQRRRFDGREALGRMPEPDERCGFDPDDVGPVGGERQIGFENPALFVVRFVAKRHEHLFEFSRPRAGLKVSFQTRHLHRDGRSADRARARGALPGGAKNREGVDAGVRPEPPVFVAHDRVERLGTHAVEPHGKAILPVGSGFQVKEFPVRVEHGLSVGDRLHQGRRGHEFRPRPEARRQRGRGAERKGDGNRSGAQKCHGGTGE